MLNKKGMQFIWIFSLIAGVTILFLFSSFALKYKDMQEQKIDVEILKNLNNGIQRLQGSEHISVKIDFPKETTVRCGNIILRSEHNTKSILFSGEKLKDDVVMWQQPFNFPFKITNFYYLVDKNNKFSISEERLLADIPDSLNGNFNSIEGRKVFFSRSAYTENKNNYYVNEELKYVEHLENRYDYYNDEMLLGLLISDNQECIVEEVREKIKEISEVYFNKASLLKDCEYAKALEILNDMKNLKRVEENSALLKKENKRLIGGNCVGIY